MTTALLKAGMDPVCYSNSQGQCWAPGFSTKKVLVTFSVVTMEFPVMVPLLVEVMPFWQLWSCKISVVPTELCCSAAFPHLFCFSQTVFTYNIFHHTLPQASNHDHCADPVH